MGLTGDFKKLAKAQKVIAALGQVGTPSQRAVMDGAVAAVKALTRQQFAEGIAPDGSPNRRTKSGEPAMQSEKLARGAVAIEARGNYIVGYSKNPKWAKILDAHQQGHVFPKRAGKGGFHLRGRGGRLIKAASFARLVAQANEQSKGKFLRYSFTSGKPVKEKQVASRSHFGAHHVGPRVLPPTPMVPENGALPERWGSGISRGVFLGLRKALGKIK